MDFPARPVQPTTAPEELLPSLGIQSGEVFSNGLDYLVLLPEAGILRRLKPDFSRLESISSRGVIVTARSDESQYDFLSRFFAPQSGIPEDPVTGSAHCALGPFWADRLGKSELRGYQASPRGGVVGVKVAGERVELRGKAVTVVRGELLA